MQILIDRLKFFTLIFFTTVLIACGGGNGALVSGTSDPNPEDEVDLDGTADGDGFTLSVGLYSAGTTTAGFEAGVLPIAGAVSSVSSVEAVVVAVSVVSSSGDEIDSVRVGLSADVGTLGSPNNSVLTNSNGIASTSLTVAAGDSGSTGTLTATLDGVSASLNYSVGNVDLKLGRDSNDDDDPFTFRPIDYVDGEISIQSDSLGASSSTQLSVVIVDQDNNLFTSPVIVNFTSTCNAAGEADIDTGIPSNGGRVTSTYTADGCEGTDLIRAELEQVSGVTATGQVIVQSAEISSIEFDSSNPELIALKGTGTGRVPEISDLTFRVVDDAGFGVQGVTVDFELFSNIGGVEFTGEEGGVTTVADTNSEGEVTVRVQSGSIPTSVSVIASIDHDNDGSTPDITTSSNDLLISTGLPDQDSFSISATILNPGGHDEERVISQININPADKFNNPVADNTAVTFTTEYGRVVGFCTTVDGSCSVDWNSQSPRFPPSDVFGNVLTINDRSCDTDGDGFIRDDGSDVTGFPCLHTLADTSEGLPFNLLDNNLDGNRYRGEIFGGRTTILAYAVGEESFTDSNSNGRYDIGEPFEDLAEAFIDFNEDGVFGSVDTVGGCESPTDTDTVGIDCSNWRPGGDNEVNIDLSGDGAHTPGNGIYNGSLCSDTADMADACVKDLVNVRASVRLNAGAATPEIGFYNANDQLLVGDAADVNLLVDPADNTRTIVVSDLFNGNLPAGTIIQITADNCELLGVDRYEIGNTSEKGNFQRSIRLASDGNSSQDIVQVTVTPPDSAGGTVFSDAFICAD